MQLIASSSNNLLTITDNLSSHLKLTSIDPRAVHSFSLKLGCLFTSIYLSNNLLHAYVSRSSSPSDARQLFDEIPHPNAVTWTSLISCYTRICNLKDAVSLFKRMRETQQVPNKFTFSNILSGCTRVRDPRTGVQLHCAAVKLGFDLDTYVASTLIEMYAKCNNLNDAWQVFDQTPERNVVSWTTMISNLANSEISQDRDAAFWLFKEMVSSGVCPVSMTFASLAKVFDEPRKLNQARQAHGYISKFGVEVDDHLGSALVAMYGRCGGVNEVERLSSGMNLDAVSRTSVLSAYTQNGFHAEAILVFRRMVEENTTIDQFAIASATRACSSLKELQEVHGYALRRGLTSDVSVGNSLVTMYGRCGEVWKAVQVFRLMDDRDVISWTAVLTCYSQNGLGEEAVSVFREMIREGISAPVFSITAATSACSQLCLGGQIHSRTIRMGIDANTSVANSLIAMYSTCGDISAASVVFESMPKIDTISCNALITGLSHNGCGKKALELFRLITETGIESDDHTFIAVLSTCSRLGLVSEGHEYFRLMKEDHGLEPRMEHYACMVDLLGRAGKLREAVEFIDNSIPCKPNSSVWEALLASCNVHGDLELARFATKKILETRLDNVSPYISLSSINAEMNRWQRNVCFLDIMMKNSD